MTKWLIIIILTLISVYAYMGMSIKWQARQVDYIQKAVTNQHEPPYKYRIIVPSACWLVNRVTHSHLFTQLFMSLLIFGGMYLAVYNYFSRLLIREQTATLLFAALVPTSITPYWVLDDYIIVTIYALALTLIFDKEFKRLGLLLFIGSLIREQVIFIVPFFWIISAQKLSPKYLKATQYAIWYFVICIAGYFWPRALFGLEPSRYTWAHHIHNNLSHLSTIIPLWLAFIVPIIIFAFLRSFKLNRDGVTLGVLIVYTGCFFISGNMWELAKFLPGMLIFISLALHGDKWL